MLLKMRNSLKQFYFSVGLVEDEDDRNYHEPKSFSHERTDKELCGTGTVCTAISSCLFLQDLMDQSCLASDK